MQIVADLSIDGDGGTATVEIGVRLEDQSMTASGTPDAVAIASRTGLMDIKLDRIMLVDDDGFRPEDPLVDVIFNIRDLVTDTTIANDGQLYTISTTNTTGATIFEFSFDDGWSGLSTTVGSVDTTSSNSVLTIPVTPVDWLNLSPALRNGLAISATTEAVGSRQQTVVSMDGNITSDQTQTVDRSSQTLSVSDEGLALLGDTQGLAIGFMDSFVMPMPIEITVQAASGGMAFPLLSSADPQPVSFDLSLEGLSAPETLWSMLDPGTILPRDPATLRLGLDAQVINRVDMLDIMAWEGVIDQMDKGEIPFDLVSLDISGLEVSAIGALLTGEGAFTFDNSDRTTFPGFPRPDGQATAQMTGLYAVMDKLAQIGILPPEAGMGARAAIGMFAQATGEDQLSTTLSITNGTITVNGMPIPLP
jgi:hypothetical protein